MPDVTPTPVVLDTDLGTDVDDALCLAFALACPEIDLIGVTTVDADTPIRSAMAARLLGMAAHAEVPVHAGAGDPLGIGRMPTWFGHEGRGLLDEPWDGPEAAVGQQDAAAWLVERSHVSPFHLVAVGPFTNVAQAVELDPTFPERVTGLTVMGGMAHPEHYDPQWRQFFAETGVPPNHMDHNTAADVEAALIVARAGFDMTWVTAELTFATTLDRQAMTDFDSTGTALGNRLARMLEIWSTEWFHHIPSFPVSARPFPRDSVAALHDSLAMAAVFGGPWLTSRDHHLAFAQTGDLFSLTEVEQSAAHATHQVSVAVDREAFSAFFTDRVLQFLAGLPV